MKPVTNILSLIYSLAVVVSLGADETANETRAALRYVSALESEFLPAEQKHEAAILLAKLGPRGVAAAPILADIINAEAPRDEFATFGRSETCFLVQILSRMRAAKEDVLPQLSKALGRAKKGQLRSRLAGLILYYDESHLLARGALEDISNSTYYVDGLSFAGLKTSARLMESQEGRLAVPAAKLLFAHSLDAKERALNVLIRWMRDDVVGFQAAQVVLSQSEGEIRAQALDAIRVTAMQSRLNGTHVQMEAAQTFARYATSHLEKKHVAAVMSSIARSPKESPGTKLSAAQLCDDLNNVTKGKEVTALVGALDHLQPSENILSELRRGRSIYDEPFNRAKPKAKIRPSKQEIGVIEQIALLVDTSELARYHYEKIMQQYELPVKNAFDFSIP